MLNSYSLSKNLSLLVLFIIGVFYAIPNLFGEDYALQISKVNLAEELTEADKVKVLDFLKENKLIIKQVGSSSSGLLLRFFDAETQLKARDVLKEKYVADYVVALNLAPATPAWLEAIGASPMRLGLDLRGGVHFLMEVDLDAVIERKLETYAASLKDALREEKLRYKSFSINARKMVISFTKAEFANKFRELYVGQAAKAPLPGISFTQRASANGTSMVFIGEFTDAELNQISNYTVEQTTTTLRNRVNELGVSEAVIQRQGKTRVVVELPGIQNTARAKEILGKTATLEFRLKDERIYRPGKKYAGAKVYFDKNRIPYLLKNKVILTGESIVGAVPGSDENGRPVVALRVGGNLALFKKTTRENIGKMLGVVYIETRMEDTKQDDQVVAKKVVKETLINIANIQSALGNSFQISGLNQAEASNLSLMLRAGSLPAPVSIVEEKTVGPSLGLENIELGKFSMQIGMISVFVFMLLYYRMFGLIANVALCVNVVLLVSILSILGATLTLPGIAGIVLTVGMAVDANVLIFERIREEMRANNSIQLSIHKGFDKALTTIMDANITTLIVAIILFSVGTGAVKGFAITLSLGILTSVLTAVVYTRAIVNLFYGRGQRLKTLSIGI